MDYQVSARKYRPGTFQDVIGQPHVVQTLANAISTNRIAHAFIFSGTRGVGKTTVARILAKALNCEQGPTPTPCDACPTCTEITQGTSVDVIEIDGASNTGVDDVREIRENVKFSPFRGQYRVYIIDEVHMLSNSAFNALLKTLEEPPAHVVFIFATTEIHKIPATILSRCQHYNFRRIPTAEIVQRLRYVADADQLTVEDRSLAAITRASEGSMRDALSILDQIVAFSGKNIQHQDLEALIGSIPHEHIRTMIAAIAAQDSPSALRVVANLLDQGHDLRGYCSELVEHVRNLLVASLVPADELRGLIEASEEDLGQTAADAKAFAPEHLQELFRIFTQAEEALRQSAHPRFVLEVAVVRATRTLTARPGDLQATAKSRTVSTTPSSREEPGEPHSDHRASIQPPAALPPAPHARVTTEPATKGDQMQRPERTSPTGESKVTTAEPSQGRGRSASTPLGSLTASVEEPSTSPRTPTDGTGHPEKGANPDSTQTRPAGEVSPAIQFNWEAVLDRVMGTHPNIGAFLEMGSVFSVDDCHITIGYSRTASVARAVLEKEENIRLVTDICAELAGRPVKVSVTELPDASSVGPSMAQIRAVKERTRKDALLEQTRSHPLVKQALSVFGGDLADVRQTPPQKEAP